MAFLNELDSKRLLAEEGFEVTMPEVVSNLEEAKRAAERIGYPVVVKVFSNRIVHKSDVGGVVVGIEDEAALKRSYSEVLLRAREIDPEAKVCIQKCVPKGVELVVGIHTDESFGKVMMFGIGGVFVELLKDVSFRLVPIGEEDAVEMIEEIKAKALLDGFRGLPAVDKGALSRFLVKVSDVAQGKGIVQMDLNPVIAYGDRFVVVDARVLL